MTALHVCSAQFLLYLKLHLKSERSEKVSVTPLFRNRHNRSGCLKTKCTYAVALQQYRTTSFFYYSLRMFSGQTTMTLVSVLFFEQQYMVVVEPSWKQRRIVT